MKLRLTSRIIVYFVSLVAVLLAAVGALSYRSGTRSLKAAAISELVVTAIEKEAAVNSWMEERLADVMQMAEESDLVEKAGDLVAAAPESPEAATARAILLKELTPHLTGSSSNYIEIFVIEPEHGKVLASTRPGSEGKLKLGHSYFDNGRTNLYLQLPYRSVDLNTAAMTAAIPLRASNGTVVAVLAARLNLTVLNAITQRRTGLHRTEDAFLINAGRFPVTQPRFMKDDAALRDRLDTEAVRRCVARRHGVSLTRDYRGVASIACYRWNDRHQFGLIAKMDQAEALAPARVFGVSVILISVFAMVGTVACAVLLARTITRPLRMLQDGVMRFGEGNLQEPLVLSSRDEVGWLAQEFNQMAKRVVDRTAELAKSNGELRSEITARKRAEHELQAAHAQLEQMVAYSPAVIYRLKVEGGAITPIISSENITTLLGFEVSETLSYDWWFGQLHPEDRDRTLASISEVLEQGKSRTEYRLRHKGGDYRWVDDHRRLLRDPLGQAREIVGVWTDVTQRKEAECALRLSQDKMRLQSIALESAANGAAITDRQGTIQWINPAFTQLTGYSAEEAIGQTPRILKSGKNPESLYKEMWQSISAGQTWRGELINRRKDGRLYYDETTITPVRDSAGAISHFIAVKQDVSDRKRVQEELERKTAVLEAQLDSTLDGILVVGGQNEQLLKNERFKQVWKIPPHIAADTDDRKCLEFATSQTRDPEQFARTVAHLYSHPEQISRDEIELIDGTVLDRYSAPVRHQNGRLYGRIWIFHDITEQKRVEAAMQDLHKKLQDASREAGMAEVATNVLHNVGNVLNSVNVSSGLIAKSLKTSKVPNLAKVASLLQAHAKDLADFVANDPRGKLVPEYVAELSAHLMAEQERDLRELASLQGNVEHIKNIVAMQQRYARLGGLREPVNIPELVEDSLRMTVAAFGRHGVKLARQIEVVPTLNTEKHKILQILINLLRNAKHACQESDRPDKQVTVRVTNGAERIRISVIDNGVGIPPENLTHIFAHGFTTRKDGHGFGLHSGALAAKELDGSLTVHSAGPGQGATFTLELPCPPQQRANE